MKKKAVILFNLGGPDKLSSVKSFLFNLFYDPAIINVINPFRWLIAKIISSKREKLAKDIYSEIGGKSPILQLTEEQAKGLEKLLNKEKEDEFKVFISMRYWHPFASEVIDDLEKFNPEEIFLIPLYPQFSTTTSGSSFKEFSQLIKKSKLKDVEIKAICCYYNDSKFIQSHVTLIKDYIKNIEGKYRILFSAHGLPEHIINQGDPYKNQVEKTVDHILKELSPKIDYSICYQSKVGPLKWIGPSTEEELTKAAQEDISVVIVPIAFVSDHSETLVELDIEYRDFFKNMSKKDYIRIPALNNNEHFIQSLFNQTEFMLKEKEQIKKDNLKLFTKSVCTDNFSKCICK